MLTKNFLRNLLVVSALIEGVLASNAFAVTCGFSISTSYEDVCTFDATNDVTINNGFTIGGIYQNNYIASGAITNYGTISNGLDFGINITDNSSLGRGLVNNGTIAAADNAAIYIHDTSTINNGITNTGSITNTGLDPAITIIGSTINGNINNSGIIRNAADSDGIYINTSRLEGNIINSGSITGGALNGIELNNSVTLSGSIINSGSIRGSAIAGLKITNVTTVGGDVDNSGTIRSDSDGILMDTSGEVTGDIINEAAATISGSVNGININDSSAGSIKNYGTITGGINAISIAVGSTVGSINTYEGSVINGKIAATTIDLNINGGEINGVIDVNSMNIISGHSFTASDNAITVHDVLTNSGTFALGSATRIVNGNYTQASSGVLEIDAKNIGDYGQLSVTDTVNLSASGAINVNILEGASLVIGDTLDNVVSGSTLAFGSFNITDNSRLLNFVASTSSGVDLTVVADASTSVSKSYSGLGNSGGEGAAAKLDEITASSPTGDWLSVVSSLNILSNDQQIANAVNQTTPALMGATNSAMIETTATALRIVQARAANSGISSGEDFTTKNNLWIKPFGSWGAQGNRAGVVGYDSKTYGFITGADKFINEETRLGVGFSYFNSKLGSNDNYNHVNADSFLAIAYGSHNLDENTEVNAQVAAGYNRNHSNRNINFGELNRSAKASYDGWNFQAGSGISRFVNLDRDTIIAPQIRVDYFAVTNESYQEKGAGVLNLKVASQRQAQLIPAFETKVDHKFTPKFSFGLNAGLGYDLLHDNNSVNASFEGGGSFLTRGFKPSPWIVRSGAGLTWKCSNDLDLSARYDRRDQGDYNNQTISFKLLAMF